MTATPDVQLPSITCPSSLIASCPPLLGFIPDQSLICVVHSPGSTRPVVARVDLVDDEHAGSCAVDLAARLARTGGSHVTVVLWVDVPDAATRPELPGQCLVEYLEASLAMHGLIVDLAVATNGRVWWPMLCGNPECCSDAARPVDTDVAGRVRLQYAVAGFAPLRARTDHAERLRPDPLLVARTRRHLADAGRSPGSLAHRRRQVDQLWSVLRPLASRDRTTEMCEPARHLQREQRSLPRWPTSPPGARAVRVASPEAAIRALSDVGIRDALLVRLANDHTTCRACWQHSIAVLTDVVRAAPPGHVAPGATLLGLVAWLSGDGALGSIAVERALEDDPQYRLALLAGDLFGSGIDPFTWRAMTTDLTEEDCLRKTARRPRAAR